MTQYPVFTPLGEPFALFSHWHAQSRKLDLKEPDAMTLATATSEGRPSSRTVLLKGHDERGFCFYTNLTSRKGRELRDNPHAALLFYWMELARQVRIEGVVEPVSAKEADDYFLTRQRGSQLGAWASKQSVPMEHSGDLPKRLEEITAQFTAGPVPRPPFWSGFRLVPQQMEFWEEGQFRLHKRIRYSREGEGWKVERLYP